MRIVVCIKFVQNEMNPFDACALECALGTQGAEVILLSMSPPSAEQPLKALTRLGAHQAILLTDPAFAGSDTLATSYILSLAIKKLQPDLVLCGRQSIDGDTAQVGPCLSQMLGYSLITNVMDYSLTKCGTRYGEQQVCLPALFTIERINTLRFPRLRSKMKEVTVWNAETIGADPKKCGLSGSPTRVLSTFESVSGKRRCTFIQPNELLPLIEKLRKTSRHFEKELPVSKKLKNVWAIGKETVSHAQNLAESVTLIESTDPVEIANLAKQKRPEVILWPADLWGRKTAPQTAALLQTGLCADCTQLQTDGQKLFMYRPARGGSIMAKIECRTLPQMATVRLTEHRSDIILSYGRGADRNTLTPFAEKIGAEFGASRAAVDAGNTPYALQIGLTGKSVSPRLYIAVGISGAVQHTCAIENAEFIIAVNQDKNARIFEYADYGIVADFKDVFHQ